MAYVEGVDNEYNACNGIKGSHDTVVAVATHFRLDCLGAKYRCDTRFFAPVLTGPLGPPSSQYIAYRVIVRVQRWWQLDFNHPPVSRDEVKQRVQLYVYCIVVLHGLLWGEL